MERFPNEENPYPCSTWQIQTRKTKTNIHQIEKMIAHIGPWPAGSLGHNINYCNWKQLTLFTLSCSPWFYRGSFQCDFDCLQVFSQKKKIVLIEEIELESYQTLLLENMEIMTWSSQPIKRRQHNHNIYDDLVKTPRVWSWDNWINSRASRHKTYNIIYNL